MQNKITNLPCDVYTLCHTIKLLTCKHFVFFWQYICGGECKLNSTRLTHVLLFNKYFTSHPFDQAFSWSSKLFIRDHSQSSTRVRTLCHTSGFGFNFMQITRPASNLHIQRGQGGSDENDHRFPFLRIVEVFERSLSEAYLEDGTYPARNFIPHSACSLIGYVSHWVCSIFQSALIE